MIGAALALATGVTVLAVYRLSGSPAGAGVLVFIVAWVVAIGCAMQLSAVLDRLPVGGAWRFLLKATAWAVVVMLTGWVMLRAPGPELLTGLLTVPALIGIVAVMAGGPDRRIAVVFLAVALALSALLVPAAMERLG